MFVRQTGVIHSESASPLRGQWCEARAGVIGCESSEEPKRDVPRNLTREDDRSSENGKPGLFRSDELNMLRHVRVTAKAERPLPTNHALTRCLSLILIRESSSLGAPTTSARRAIQEAPWQVTAVPKDAKAMGPDSGQRPA